MFYWVVRLIWFLMKYCISVFRLKREEFDANQDVGQNAWYQSRMKYSMPSKIWYQFPQVSKHTHIFIRIFLQLWCDFQLCSCLKLPYWVSLVKCHNKSKSTCFLASYAQCWNTTILNTVEYFIININILWI